MREVHAVLAVQVGEDAPTSGPRTRSNGWAAGSTTTTSHPASRAAAATSSPIHPAPSTAIRRPARRARLEPSAVLDRAQVVRPGRRCRRPIGSRRGGRAGGEQQPVVGQVLGIGADRVRVGVERRAGEPSRSSTSWSSVPARVVDERLLELLVAQEVALGQRRPLVGQVGLGGEQHQPSVVPRRAERLGAVRGGESAADEHDGPGAVGQSWRSLTAAGQREELCAGGRVLTQRAEERRGDGAGTGRAHAAQAHARVLGLDHDPHAAGREVVLEVLGDLLGQPLLGLRRGG